MNPYGFLIDFGILFLCAKLMENKRWPFYAAAAFFVAVTHLVEIMTPLLAELMVQSATSASLPDWTVGLSSIFNITILLRYIVAATTLFLLSRLEDTLANWLGVFVVGYLILAFVL